MKNSTHFRIVTAALVCLTSLHESSAQNPDSTKGVLKVHLDMRATLSQNRRLRMGGTSIGWEWGKKRDEITVGYYWTGKRGRNDIARLKDFEAPFQMPQEAETDIRFANLGYWLTIRDWPRWKLSTPVEAGIGRAKFTSPIDETTGDVTVERVKIFPVQLAVYGEWKATRWLGTGIQAGYRYYFNDHQPNALKPLGGMYYRIRVLVYMQTFYDWRNFIFRKEPLKSPFY